MLTNHVPCLKICVAWKNLEDNFIIIENLNLSKFKAIKFVEFITWYEWRINEGFMQNSQQERKDEIIYFLFVFESKILEIKNIDLENLYPNYPWKKDILNQLKNENIELNFLYQKLNFYNKKTNDLENTNKELKSVIEKNLEKIKELEELIKRILKK